MSSAGKVIRKLSDSVARTPKEWNPPKRAAEMYHLADGNKFASINAPTAGAREQKELPAGDKPIQLYSLATPNGQKVSIALEEMELEYDAHLIKIWEAEQFTSGFVGVNPNSKIPCMVDRKPEFGGEPMNLFESGSILLYLAEKTGRFIPTDSRERIECLNWLFWQMGSQGPYTGQFGHFYRYAPKDQVDARKYGIARYAMEAQRLLSVLDQHLEGKDWMVGKEITIADFAIYPWVNVFKSGYDAETFLELEQYKNVNRWMDVIAARPKVQVGMKVCGAN